MVEMRRIRSEMPRFATTVYHGLSNSLDTAALAKRQAPIPHAEYEKVLLDAGGSGRSMRAIVSLAAPIKDISVTAISDFMLSYEHTGSGQLGRNHFAAFSDASSFRVVEPEPISWLTKIAHSDYARERQGLIKEVPDFYYLTPARSEDVVLAPWACNCCFDAQYLDYLKSSVDLKDIGSLLVIRMLSTYFDQIDSRLKMSSHFMAWMSAAGLEPAESPFLGWMPAAGFEPTVFLAFNPIGRTNVLFPLAGHDIAAEMKDILTRLACLLNIDENSGSFKRSFELYLAFQRIKLVGNKVLRDILMEAVAWEKERYDERHKPSSIPGIGTPKDEAMERFARFEEQLEAL